MKASNSWVCGVLFVLLAWPALADQIERESIEVVGEATASLEPDYIEWVVEIKTTDLAPQVALQVNDRLLESLLKIAKGEDIKEQDITTGRPMVEQLYRDRRGSESRDQYDGTEARRRVILIMKDMDEFEDMLVQVQSLGMIYAVRYKSSKYDKTYRQVKHEALKHAKQIASEEAGVIGQKIGPALHVTVEQQHANGGGSLFGDPEPITDDLSVAGPDGMIRIAAYAKVKFLLEP